MSIASLFRQLTIDYADRPAVLMGGSTLTYSGLWDAAARVTSLLSASGLAPRDRVAIMLPDIPAFPIACYGALCAGGVVVPMSPQLKSREIAYHLADSGARVIFCWHAVAGEVAKAAPETGTEVIEVGEPHPAGLLAGFAPAAASVEPAGDDDAVILYTSGTTGKPKGARLTHANLIRNAQVVASTVLEAGPGDVVLSCLPLFHVSGLTCALNATLLSGATLILLPRFDTGEALDIISRNEVTIFEGVPTMFAAMLRHLAHPEAAAASSLRTCISGGTAMLPDVMRRFEQAFGCTILEGYGLSETSPVAAFNHRRRIRKPGSVGTAIEGVEMRVVDLDGLSLPPGNVGEVVIRGHNVMKGYWGLPDATAEVIRDGWFHTGDLGTMDTDGYIYIVGRKKDLIVRAGSSIFPREIEEVLQEHPAVAEAAVIGIPHIELGEEVGAAVRLKAGMAASITDLHAFLAERVAAYKRPHHLWLVPELPKGPTGKILRRAVKPPPNLGRNQQSQGSTPI